MDTRFYDDLNSMTVTETLGGQTANYAFSIDPEFTANVMDGGTFFIIGNGETTTRNIVSILNSIHGGTEGNWYINTNATYGSETWGAASSNNIHDAVSESMDTAKNIMAGADVDGVADGDWPAFGDYFASAFILYSDSDSASPIVDGVSFNYDGSVLNRQKYDYTVDMMSVDIIKVKAPSSGGPRNARVYVSK